MKIHAKSSENLTTHKYHCGSGIFCEILMFFVWQEVGFGRLSQSICGKLKIVAFVKS